MTLIEKLALTLMALFTYLMIGPIWFGYVGDIYLHCALLFEAVPAALIAAFFATITWEILS